MYTLNLIHDGIVIKSENFDDSYGYLENGCQSDARLWNIAKDMMNAAPAGGVIWVQVYEDGIPFRQYH